MPDTDHVSETLTPENPGITTAENVPVESANPVAQTSTFEKIGRAAESVFESAGLPFRRGRGRPANCKGCGRPETKCRCDKLAAKSKGEPVAAAVPSPAPAPVAAPVAVDNPEHGALFRRSVASAVKGLLGFAKSFAKGKAVDAGINADFAEKALRECEPETDVMNDFSESLETVLKKYNANTEYSPEIALGVSVIRMAAPYALLIKTFNAEIARKRREETAAALKGDKQ